MHLSPGHFFYTDNPKKFANLKCKTENYGKFYQVSTQITVDVQNGVTENVEKYSEEAHVFSHYTMPSFVPYITMQYCCRNDYGHIFNGEKNISRSDYRKHYCFLYFIILGKSLKNTCGDLWPRIAKYLVPHFDDFYEFAIASMHDNWEKMYAKKINECSWWNTVCKNFEE